MGVNYGVSDKETLEGGGAKVQPVDPHGHHTDMSFMRTLATHTPVRMVGTGFVGSTVDTNFWTVASGGAGASAAQTARHVTLTSGTANDGYAHLRSAQTARFVFAHPMIYRSAVSLTTIAVAGNSRLHGAFTVTGTPPVPVDGYWFEHDPDGTVNAAYAKSGSITKIPIVFVLDTNMHAFEIHYFLMKVEWYIDDVLVHSIDSTDITDDLVDDFNLPIAALSKNSAAGTTSGELLMHAAVIIREGLYETAPVSVYQSGITAGVLLKRGPGVLHRMPVSGVANGSVITLYDNVAASGTVLWSSGTMGAQTKPFDVTLAGIPFYTGLTLVIASSAAIVTVIYE